MIPEGVRKIGYNVFGGYTQIIRVVIPGSADDINDMAFGLLSETVQIQAPAGSCAQRIATKWSIPFLVE